MLLAGVRAAGTFVAVIRCQMVFTFLFHLSIFRIMQIKKFFLFTFLCLALASVQGQVLDTTCIVSNTNSGWGASHNQNGPFGPVFNVSLCTNECVIDCICGEGYGSPHVSEHFDTCCTPRCGENVVAIWGEPSPWNCYFQPTTFWFRQTFQFDSSACNRLESIVASIQGDQNFQFFLNDSLIGTSTTSDWDSVFTYNNLNIGHLVNGENEILIRVNNINGGSCFNYAFLAFCMQIVTSLLPAPNPSFNHQVNQTGGDYTITCTATNTDPAFDHDWLVLWGDDPLSQPNLFGYFPDHGPVLDFDPDEDFPQCRYFLVLHRVYPAGVDSSDCEACWAELIPICRQGAKGGEVGGRTAIDCRIFDEYRRMGRPGGERSSPSSGSSKASVLQVSPNPTRDMLHVEWAAFPAHQLRVFNLNGQVLEQKNLAIGVSSSDLQVGSLPVGLYILELKNQESGEKLTQMFSVNK
jgi:hypothetical protein